jgi:hypothetical protein
MYRKQVTCSSMPQKLNAYQYPAGSGPQGIIIINNNAGDDDNNY